MTKPKCVLDTNVYLSAILYGGNPRKILHLAKQHKIQLFISLDILLEISNKLNLKFKLNDETISKILRGIVKLAAVVKPKLSLTIVKSDPSDNKILECAHEAKANYIITGDTHLLGLKKFASTKILNPTHFLKLLHSRSPRT